jgi:hypothetical protein
MQETPLVLVRPIEALGRRIGYKGSTARVRIVLEMVLGARVRRTADGSQE